MTMTEIKRISIEHILKKSASTFMSRLFNSSFEGIVVTDLDGVILEVNYAFSIITGYSREEALGQNPRILKSDRHDNSFYKNMWRSMIDNGEWEGEIWNRRKGGEVYPEWLIIRSIIDDDGSVIGYMSSFYDLSEKRNMEHKLKEYALFDGLTGLPNRNMFIEQLSERISSISQEDEKLALICIDIDRFKQVNESLGHIKGDELLVKIAKRLLKAISSKDIVCRFSGDSFYVILSNKRSMIDVLKSLKSIQRIFFDPFTLDGESFFLSATEGVSIFPDDGKDHETLLRKGEMALFRAKESKKGSYLFFSERLERRGSDKLKLESELRRGLIRGELKPFYQPQVDILSGEIVGFEALSRWNSPERGLISPGEFIPVAEETGLIGRLDFMMFEKACMWSKDMEEKTGRIVPISVNFSPRSLFSSDLTGYIGTVLRDLSMKPDYINLEITESAAMDDVDRSLELFRKLKDMGLAIHLDDFGTGYSSLNYLHKFPVDCLKIDQSFMRDIFKKGGSLPIVRSVIALGHSLGLTVLAEGVETEKQMTLLKELKCDLVQGFYYSKPLSEEDASSFSLDPI